MKKIVLGSVALLSLSTLIFLSCEKETENKSKADRNLPEKAAGKSSCAISCFWGSCSITCEGGKTGSPGAASCSCVGLGPFGILGAVASCTCGHLGVHMKGFHVGPEIIFDETNIENFLFLKDVVREIENPSMDRFKTSLQALIAAARDPDGKVRAEQFNRFLDELANIDFDDAAYIRPHLLKRAAVCGREL